MGSQSLAWRHPNPLKAFSALLSSHWLVFSVVLRTKKTITLNPDFLMTELTATYLFEIYLDCHNVACGLMYHLVYITICPMPKLL